MQQYKLVFFNQMMKLILVSFFSLPIASAHITELCELPLADLPIQQSGRIKPLKVHADETLKYISNNKLPKGYNTIKSYCLLSLNSMGINDSLNLRTYVEHKDTKNFLKEELKTDSYLSMEKLLDIELKIRGKIISEKRMTPLKKELNKLYGRLETYRSIKLGQDWLLPEFSQADLKWTPYSQLLQQTKIPDIENASKESLASFIQATKTEYLDQKGSSHLLELKFHKAKIFHWAMVLVIICLVMQFLSVNKKLNASMLALTIGIQIIGIVLRVIISGRAPVTNMYETVMFSGLGSLILACIVSLYRKETIYIGAGLAYNFCCLMMMNFAHGMLNPGISPLVPVLRDNFWLSTHVTMIVFSYGALALSWALSNFVLIKGRFSVISTAEYKKYSDLIYTCDKYGTICLSAGIILGGLWADYSWGRFWGWDPKETWSLIVFLIYLAILHGKNTSWIPNERFIALNAAAFMSVMMAWFGVNYILAAGLHSYGFSEGGAIFLGSFFAVQIALLVITKFKTTPQQSA